MEFLGQACRVASKHSNQWKNNRIIVLGQSSREWNHSGINYCLFHPFYTCFFIHLSLWTSQKKAQKTWRVIRECVTKYLTSSHAWIFQVPHWGYGEGISESYEGWREGAVLMWRPGCTQCDTSGILTDRCRQEMWQQVECSYLSCTVEGTGGRRAKTTSAVTNLCAFGVQRHRLVTGGGSLCVGCICVSPGVQKRCGTDSDL